MRRAAKLYKRRFASKASKQFLVQIFSESCVKQNREVKERLLLKAARAKIRQDLAFLAKSPAKFSVLLLLTLFIQSDAARTEMEVWKAPA